MGEIVKEKKKRITKKELEEKLVVVTKEKDEYKELLQRVSADFQNYKKRMEKEREEWQKFAAQNLIFELLEVLDNFELALSYKDKDESNPIWEGVNLINSKLKEILNKWGLTRIEDPVGKRFDPNIHEALFYEEGDVEEGIILSQCRAGYELWGRLLRPIRVVVSKGKKRETQEGVI